MTSLSPLSDPTLSAPLPGVSLLQMQGAFAAGLAEVPRREGVTPEQALTHWAARITGELGEDSAPPLASWQQRLLQLYWLATRPLVSSPEEARQYPCGAFVWYYSAGLVNQRRLIELSPDQLGRNPAPPPWGVTRTGNNIGFNWWLVEYEIPHRMGSAEVPIRLLVPRLRTSRRVTVVPVNCTAVLATSLHPDYAAYRASVVEADVLPEIPHGLLLRE